MKILKYNLCTKVNRGTEEEPQMEEMVQAAADKGVITQKQAAEILNKEA